MRTERLYPGMYLLHTTQATYRAHHVTDGPRPFWLVSRADRFDPLDTWDEPTLTAAKASVTSVETRDAAREDHDEGCHGTPRNA